MFPAWPNLARRSTECFFFCFLLFYRYYYYIPLSFDPGMPRRGSPAGPHGRAKVICFRFLAVPHPFSSGTPLNPPPKVLLLHTFYMRLNFFISFSPFASSGSTAFIYGSKAGERSSSSVDAVVEQSQGQQTLQCMGPHSLSYYCLCGQAAGAPSILAYYPGPLIA